MKLLVIPPQDPIIDKFLLNLTKSRLNENIVALKRYLTKYF
jgi:hypothetical protein